MTDNEIIRTLRACARGESEGCPFTEKYGCDGCPKVSADLIERLTAENAALREMQWRKIASDGTPQEKGYYIAFVERAIGEKPAVRQAYWTGEEWRSCEKRYKITPRVTHWRPMPGAPEEDRKA